MSARCNGVLGDAVGLHVSDHAAYVYEHRTEFVDGAAGAAPIHSLGDVYDAKAASVAGWRRALRTVLRDTVCDIGCSGLTFIDHQGLSTLDEVVR